MISGKTKIFGLFGCPVEHTFSPAMHNAAFEAIGLDACYAPFPVSPEKLHDAVRAIAALGLCGVNVTVPHKEKVIAALDELSEEARMIGAVNAIEVRDGKLIGHNTDGRGFIRSLRDDAGFKARGKRIVLVGAGGAARAVGFCLALAGAKEIVVYDLDGVKAAALADDIRVKTKVAVRAIGHGSVAEAAADADCLINATPLGMKKTDPSPIDRSLIGKGMLVCDLVYNPPETKLLKEAKARGANCLSGSGMLLFQGVIAFELWTGKKAPVAVMKKALLRQIAARRKAHGK
jgi:shikimate dehydrogenase